MPLLKYVTLAVALSRVAAEGPCVDEPGATLPGGWDCARIAEYIAGSDVHSCSWAGPWLSVMVAPKLAEEAAAKCPQPEPTFEEPEAVVAAMDVNADTINYEAKWAPMEVVIALFIFVTCAFSMTRLCRAKEDQYAPVTRAISEEDLVAPEEDVERGPTLEDKRRMLD